MKERVNLIGRKFGKLQVIDRGEDYISPGGVKLKRWKCKCDCGNIINVTTSQLKRGQKSCGCISTRDDLTGRIFGDLTVLYSVEDYVSPKGSHMSKWHCRCICGNEIDVLGMSLKNGDTKSCGCKSGFNRNKNRARVLPESIIGKTFGYLTVIKCVDYEGNIKSARFLCECICKNKKEVSYSALIKNSKISCGCMNKKPISKTHKKPTSVVGDVYNQLTILEELEPHITPNGSKQRIVKCECSCGNVFDARLVSAKKNGKCRQCLDKDRRIDISGKRFGKLVVLSMAEDYVSPSGHRLSRCRCMCDCGNETTVNMSELVTGATKSCGCLLNHKGLLKDNKLLLDRYDYEKNKDIDINTLTARTSKKVWWKCEKCGNSWYATIASQNDEKQHGCPYCSGRFVIKGKTDLLSQFPEIAAEWDYLKNKTSPDEISAKSSSKAWWTCKQCGRGWSATISNRTGNLSGCPHCNKENVNSFCEQAVFYYIHQAFHDAINSDKHLGVELDIYIPSKKVAIEYDGEAWHSDKKRIQNDIKKNAICKEHGITMLRIREPKLETVEGCIIIRRKDSTTDNSLNEAINKALEYLDVNTVSVNVTSDTGKILAQFASKKYKNSLAYCFPHIAKEWHPIKNGQLTPEQVSKGARRKVWWLGNCGHEWIMAVCDRTREPYVSSSGKTHKPQGCPFCAGKRILIGFNDMKSQYPEIAREWHPIKNENLTPEDVMPGSGKKVWWLGKCGHEWQATPNKRCMGNKGCPICYSHKKSPAVICIETGESFENTQEAAEKIGLKSGRKSIYSCCRGEAKTAGGYHWKYSK